MFKDEVNLLTEFDPYVRTLNSLTGLDPKYLKNNTTKSVYRGYQHLTNICHMLMIE